MTTPTDAPPAPSEADAAVRLWDVLGKPEWMLHVIADEIARVRAEEREACAALARRARRLEEALRGLMPVEGISPQWMLDCRDSAGPVVAGHVDSFAGDPGKWPVCLKCLWKAIDRALAPEPTDG